MYYASFYTCLVIGSEQYKPALLQCCSKILGKIRNIYFYVNFTFYLSPKVFLFFLFVFYNARTYSVKINILQLTTDGFFSHLHNRCIQHSENNVFIYFIFLFCFDIYIFPTVITISESAIDIL